MSIGRVARLTGPSLSQAYQDNQLRTEFNVKSGGALEPECTALHRLEVCCWLLPSCMAVWQYAEGAGTGLGSPRWVESGGARARDRQGSASRWQFLVRQNVGRALGLEHTSCAGKTGWKPGGCCGVGVAGRAATLTQAWWQVLEEAHRLWLVANEHYREAHRALAARVHNAGARAQALTHLASACWVHDNNASKLAAAEPLFPPAGRELRALLLETLQDKLGLPLDTASAVVLGSPEKMHLLAQVAEAVLSAVCVLDATSIQDISAQTAAIVDKMMQVTARGAQSCPASEAAMQRLAYVHGKAHSMSRGLPLSPSSGGPGSRNLLPELPLIPVPQTREEARGLAQRLQGSHDMAENPAEGAQDLTDQAMQLDHRARTPKGDDPMDVH